MALGFGIIYPSQKKMVLPRLEPGILKNVCTSKQQICLGSMWHFKQRMEYVPRCWQESAGFEVSFMSHWFKKTVPGAKKSSKVAGCQIVLKIRKC